MPEKKGLKVLSVQTSNKCSINCPFCYLDKTSNKEEKEHNWWLEFFQSLNDVEQVALGWNEQDVSEICQYAEIGQKKGIMVNLTTNTRNITQQNVEKLSKVKIKMISISVDRYKCKKITDVANPVHLLKNGQILSGTNLLLDDDIVHHLDLVVQNLLYMGVDVVYALQPKPNTLTVDLQLLKRQLLLCTALFGRKFAVDESLKLKLGKISSCGRGKKLLSVNSEGRVSLCSFDRPFKDYDGVIGSENIETKECPFL